MAASGQPALGERCCAASRRTARTAAPAPTRPVQAAAAADEEQRDEPRGREVHEVVEARRGPAEGLVARRAVADHAVGGVRRPCRARRRRARRAPSQKAGATTPSEKFSARLSIAARQTPASSRECGIAPDDHRHRGAGRPRDRRRAGPPPRRRRARAGCAAPGGCRGQERRGAEAEPAPGGQQGRRAARSRAR